MMLVLCGCRLIIGLGYALLVWWTPSVRHDGGFPLYYYAIVLLSYALHQVPLRHAHLLSLTSCLCLCLCLPSRANFS